MIDLDCYHRGGPFENVVGRMYGSTRFMAPEEFQRGQLIDGRTTVFNLGRAALVFLADGALRGDEFRGTDSQLEVVRRACEPDPAQRFASVDAFYSAWSQAEFP